MEKQEIKARVTDDTYRWLQREFPEGLSDSDRVRMAISVARRALEQQELAAKSGAEFVYVFDDEMPDSLAEREHDRHLQRLIRVATDPIDDAEEADAEADADADDDADADADTDSD